MLPSAANLGAFSPHPSSNWSRPEVLRSFSELYGHTTPRRNEPGALGSPPAHWLLAAVMLGGRREPARCHGQTVTVPRAPGSRVPSWTPPGGTLREGRWRAGRRRPRAKRPSCSFSNGPPPTWAFADRPCLVASCEGLAFRPNCVLSSTDRAESCHSEGGRCGRRRGRVTAQGRSRGLPRPIPPATNLNLRREGFASGGAPTAATLILCRSCPACTIHETRAYGNRRVAGGSIAGVENDRSVRTATSTPSSRPWSIPLFSVPEGLPVYPRDGHVYREGCGLKPLPHAGVVSSRLRTARGVFGPLVEGLTRRRRPEGARKCARAQAPRGPCRQTATRRILHSVPWNAGGVQSAQLGYPAAGCNHGTHRSDGTSESHPAGCDRPASKRTRAFNQAHCSPLEVGPLETAPSYTDVSGKLRSPAIPERCALAEPSPLCYPQKSADKPAAFRFAACPPWTLTSLTQHATAGRVRMGHTKLA